MVKQFGCEVKKQELQLFCNVDIGIPKARLNEVIFKLKELHTVEVVEGLSNVKLLIPFMLNSKNGTLARFAIY